MSRWILGALLISAFSVSCSSKPCRNLRQPELAAQQDKKAPTSEAEVAAPAVAAAPAASASKAQAAAGSSSVKDATVLVYKADGSLQCGAARGISAEEMEKSLSGIKVFSRENRSDGLMHIQVCGSPTGMINVFEISASALPRAEKLGFKRFESR